MLLVQKTAFLVQSIFLLAGNVSAMVSTGIKSSELSIIHLAKTFYFVLYFLF